MSPPVVPRITRSGTGNDDRDLRWALPPLYWAIVGLPSLVWHSDLAVYLMRLLSGFLSALFLGLAIALAVTWSRSRLLVLALAVTVDPMVIIFGSVVNPSGLEMATAVCVWTGGLVLVLDRSNRPPPSLVAATAASAAAMVLIRGLSPLWLVVIAAFLFSLRPRSLSELIRSPSVRWSAVAVVVAGVAATTYILWAHALSLTYIGAVSKGTSEVGVIELALGRTLGLVKEFVGTIGWVQSSPPLAVIGLWVLPASTVVLAGLVASLRRHVMVLVAIMIASFVLPTALMASQARGAGVGVWQARDGFPLYAGIVLVSGAVAGRSWQPSWDYPGATATVRMVLRRLPLLVAICVGAAQVGDFVWALRRYSVGLGATVNPFAHVPGGWSPPISSVGLVIFMTTTAFVYSWWIVRLGRRALEARSPNPERSTISVSEEWELAAPSDSVKPTRGGARQGLRSQLLRAAATSPNTAPTGWFFWILVVEGDSAEVQRLLVTLSKLTSSLDRSSRGKASGPVLHRLKGRSCRIVALIVKFHRASSMKVEGLVQFEPKLLPRHVRPCGPRIERSCGTGTASRPNGPRSRNTEIPESIGRHFDSSIQRIQGDVRSSRE